MPCDGYTPKKHYSWYQRHSTSHLLALVMLPILILVLLWCMWSDFTELRRENARKEVIKTGYSTKSHILMVKAIKTSEKLH